MTNTTQVTTSNGTIIINIDRDVPQHTWKSINPDVITAWAALAAVLVAIWAVRRDSRNSKFTVMVDLLSRQDDLLKKDPCTIAARNKAASNLLDHNRAGAHLTDVLNHFEFIGLLVRRGAIDKEMAWSTFYSRAIGWWTVAADYIKDSRRDDKTVWCDFEYLVDELLAIEAKKTGKTASQIGMTDKEKREFLNHERDATAPS